MQFWPVNISFFQWVVLCMRSLFLLVELATKDSRIFAKLLSSGGCPRLKSWMWDFVTFITHSKFRVPSNIIYFYTKCIGPKSKVYFGSVRFLWWLWSLKSFLDKDSCLLVCFFSFFFFLYFILAVAALDMVNILPYIN